VASRNEIEASSWDWLISRAIIGWNARVENGGVRLLAKDALKLGFVDHLRRAMPLQALRLSSTDIEYALERFLVQAPSFLHWYLRMQSAGAIHIDWSLRQPWIELESIPSWIALCNDLEPDAVVALAWAQRLPRGTEASDRAALAMWPTTPRSGDHALRVLCKRGLSDMHVHSSGVRLVQQAWIGLMINQLPSERMREMGSLYKRESDVLSADVMSAKKWRGYLAAKVGVDLNEEARDMANPTGEQWFVWSKHQLRSERQVLISAWRHVQTPDHSDDDVVKLLDRYTHLKNRFYRRARQPALVGARGLRDFDTRYFKSLKRENRIDKMPRRYRKSGAAGRGTQQGQSYAQSIRFAMQPTGDACRYLLESEDLKRVELRIAPFGTAVEYWRQFSRFNRLIGQLKRAHTNRDFEIRFAVHFKRSNEVVPGGVPNLFQRLRELDRDTAALRLALADPTKYQEYLGALARIDVAGQERDTALNVYAMHLQLLRGNPEALSALEAIAHRARSGGETFPFLSRWISLVDRGEHRPHGWERPLGLTVHAGEDYADPLDGLYQIATAIEACGLQSGDSIGHGLALADGISYPPSGLFPLIPRGAAFDSQCWLLDFLDRKDLAGDLRQERNQLVDLVEHDGSRIYRRSRNAAYFLEKWKETRLPDQPGSKGDRRPALSNDVRDKAIYAAREELLDVGARHGLERAVASAQKHLIEVLSRRGVVVELNPSSNLRISGSRELADSPTLALLKQSAENLLVSINTDNPGVFSSAIENEYALLLASIRAETSPLKERQLRELLEAARATGMEILR